MSGERTSFVSPARPNELQCVAAVKQQLGITEANNNCGPGRRSPYLDPADTSFFLDDITLFRYSRVSSANPSKTIEALQNTFKWRQQYRPFAIRYEEVKPFFDQGVCFCHGSSTISNIPVTYMIPAENIPVPAETRVRAGVWLNEELQRRGYRSVVTLVNTSYLSSTNAEDDKQRDMAMSVGDAHYPMFSERSMIVGGVSFALKMIIKLIMAFMPPWKSESVYIMPDERDVAAVVAPQARYSGMPGGQLSIAPYKPSDALALLPPPLPGSAAAARR